MLVYMKVGFSFYVVHISFIAVPTDPHSQIMFACILIHKCAKWAFTAAHFYADLLIEGRRSKGFMCDTQGKTLMLAHETN